MVDCNAFQYCAKHLQQLGKIMVLVVLAFVVLSWWAVVVDVVGPLALQGSALQRCANALSAALFSALVAMLLWCWVVALITDPGRVPGGWHPFQDEEEADAELERLMAERRSGGERLAGTPRPRWCRKCRAWKPERAHHDSITGRCVLKMDHYCIWVLNCIGLLNYKAFLLFLAYAFAACTYATAVLARAFVDFLTDGRDATTPSALVFIAFVVDAAFALSLLGFIIMHARLLVSNCTTIEMYEKRRVDDWPYDYGRSDNLRSVFGSSWRRWLVPYYNREETFRLLEASLNPSHSGQGKLTHAMQLASLV